MWSFAYKHNINVRVADVTEYHDGHYLDCKTLILEDDAIMKSVGMVKFVMDKITVHSLSQLQ